MRCKIIAILIVSLLVLVSCDGRNEDVSDGSDSVMLSSFAVPEPSESDILLNESSYPVAEFDFDVNDTDKTINGIYQDDLYTIDYSLTYNDHNVESVSYYGCSPRRQVAPKIVNTDFNSCIFEADVLSSYPVLSENGESLSYIRDLYASMTEADVDGVTCARPISDRYEEICDISDSVLSFAFNRNNETFWKQHISIRNSISGQEYEEDLQNGFYYYIMREEIDGLPVGSPECLHQTYSSTVRVGDYYGRFWGISDQSMESYLSVDDGVLIDMIYYNYSEYVVENGPFEVISPDECISNSIPALAFVMEQNNTDHATVCYAELIYYPFSSDCFSTGFNFDPKMVPVWALYYFSGDEESKTVFSGVIFLDAVDGHCLSTLL